VERDAAEDSNRFEKMSKPEAAVWRFPACLLSADQVPVITNKKGGTSAAYSEIIIPDLAEPMHEISSSREQGV